MFLGVSIMLSGVSTMFLGAPSSTCVSSMFFVRVLPEYFLALPVCFLRASSMFLGCNLSSGGLYEASDGPRPQAPGPGPGPGPGPSPGQWPAFGRPLVCLRVNDWNVF